MAGSSDGIMMNMEAVEAIVQMASSMPEAIEIAKAAGSSLETLCDEVKDGLGSDEAAVRAIVQQIDDAQKDVEDSIMTVQISLLRAAKALKAMIEDEIKP